MGIIVMQRLHMDDLVGHVLEREGWEVLALPSIAEKEERHEIRALGKVRIHIRQPGEFLHEELQDEEVLERIRKNMNEYEFSAQYQQNPVPLGGAMVKAAWWQFYDRAPETFDRTIQSWDTACKNTEFGDYSVCTTWGMKDRKLYLLDVLRQKLEYPDLKRAVKQQIGRFKPDVILIEDKVSGMGLLQELPREGVRGLKACRPVLDKITRLYTHLTWIEGGNVLLPKEAPWLAEYRQELEAFPCVEKDDQVDSTSQVLAWAQSNPWAGRDLIRMAGNRISYSAKLERYVHGPLAYFDR